MSASIRRRSHLLVRGAVVAVLGSALLVPTGPARAVPNGGVVRMPGVRSAPPTPFPVETLAPASLPTTLPYPAFGESFPGANAPVLDAQVPHVLTLDQAIAIGIARSPLLDIARGDVGIARAAVRLQRAGLLPNLSGSGSFTRRHDQPGAFSSSVIGGSSSANVGSGVGTGSGTGGIGKTTAPGANIGTIVGAQPVSGTPVGTGGGSTTTTPAGARFDAAPSGFDRLPLAAGDPSTGGTTTGGTSTGGTTSGGTSLVPGVRTGDSLNAGLTVSLQQLIFDGGRIGASIKAAQHAETASADTYRRQLQTVAYNVGVAYFNDLLAQRTTAVDLQIVRQDQVQEALVGAQIRAGTTAAVDLATAQLPTAQARVAVVQAQGNEIAAGAAFANAMGLDANTSVLPQDDSMDFNPNLVQSIGVPNYGQAIARAFALRPDYDAVVQQVAQNAENLRAARRILIPTLSGIASYGLNSADTGAGSYRNSSTVGVSLTIPIFDQGIASAQIGSAQSQLAVQQATLRSSGLNLQLNVKQALASLVSFRSSIVQAQAQYNEAVQVLQATQAQYRAGVTTLPLLLNAEVQYSQAQVARVNSIYNLRLAQQALLYATGEIGTNVAANAVSVPTLTRGSSVSGPSPTSRVRR